MKTLTDFRKTVETGVDPRLDIIMRLFERLILDLELRKPVSCFIHSDQFAYNKDCGTETALLYIQHFWMRWLDGHSNFVRVLPFDFSKAFDSVSHRVVTDKLKKVPDINPYIVNWVIDFLKDRQQRVCGDKVMPHSCLLIEVCPKALFWGLYFLPLWLTMSHQPEYLND